MLNRRPRFFWEAAALDARYLSAAICSVSLCCSTLPASPDALAGAFALSRIVSCKLSDIHAAYLRMKKWSSICRNTRYACRLTEKREFFLILIPALFVPTAFLHLDKVHLRQKKWSSICRVTRKTSSRTKSESKNSENTFGRALRHVRN